jgi:hypothetical protein
MKRLFFIAGTGLLALTAISSCKKDTKLLSGRDWVVGSWRLTLQGPDKNNDGQFNAEEKNSIDQSAVVTYQFKAGSEGYRVGPNHVYVDTLQWTLENNEKTIKLMINDHGLISTQYFLVDLDYTNETLLMTDTTVKPVYFRLYQREN